MNGHADRGAATVPAAGAIAALLAVAYLIISTGLAVMTRHRARATADLAALAAAAYVSWGVDHACAQAHWVAEQMNVGLTDCRLSGVEAHIRVAARPPGSVGEFGSATAYARAGPADETPEATGSR
jgi:secretion/DNA translocation related TadE-like protein